MSWFNTQPKGPRKINPRGPHWKLADGTRVLVSALTDDHLRNALRMLHRVTDAWAWLEAANPPHGEMAQDAHSEWCGEIAELGPTALLLAGPHKHRARPLIKEWKARGYTADTWDDGSRGRMALAIFNHLFPAKLPKEEDRSSRP